jgi:dipeptide/tripeptide permease
MATNPYAAEEGRTILGHPRGLFVLFFAEMWERFSYYGMRALLILYLQSIGSTRTVMPPSSTAHIPRWFTSRR